MNKQQYVVLSWDNDEQQFFWDVVLAKDEREAREIVEEIREYAVSCDALTPKELELTAQRVLAKTDSQVAEAWSELVKEHK